MAKFNESAFEAALELAAATLEGEAEVSVDKKGATMVMEYFIGLYEGMSALLGGGDAEEEPEPLPVSTGSFLVKKSDAGFKFDLRAANNEVIASSEVYSTRAACLKGIGSIKGSATFSVCDLTQEEEPSVKNPRFEIFADKSGEYRFRVRSRNGRIIAVSEGYGKKDSCLNGIASVKKNAPGAGTREA